MKIIYKCQHAKDAEKQQQNTQNILKSTNMSLT